MSGTMIGLLIVALIASGACAVLLWPKNKPATTEQATQPTQQTQQAEPAASTNTKKHRKKKRSH